MRGIALLSNGKRASPRKCSFRSRWGLQFTLCKIPSVERSPNVDQSITQPLSHCLIFGCLITLEIMYLLIVFLPLLGSSVAGFFGRFLGSEGTAIITTTCVSFSSIFSLIAFYEVAPGASACYLRIAPWISSEMFDASWGFFGDREVTG